MKRYIRYNTNDHGTHIFDLDFDGVTITQRLKGQFVKWVKADNTCRKLALSQYMYSLSLSLLVYYSKNIFSYLLDIFDIYQEKTIIIFFSCFTRSIITYFSRT